MVLCLDFTDCISVLGGTSEAHGTRTRPSSIRVHSHGRNYCNLGKRRHCIRCESAASRTLLDQIWTSQQIGDSSSSEKEVDNSASTTNEGVNADQNSSMYVAATILAFSETHFYISLWSLPTRLTISAARVRGTGCKSTQVEDF